MTNQREHFVGHDPDLTPDLRAWFLDDREVPAAACYMTEEQIKALWLMHSEELTSEYVIGWPGKRPQVWWKYSAPGHRRKTGGSGQDAHVAMAYTPIYFFGACFQVNVDVAHPPRFQSEAAYLREHELLLPGETERLLREDFDDEVLEPNEFLTRK